LYEFDDAFNANTAKSACKDDLRQMYGQPGKIDDICDTKSSLV
jgi:hypothetical protein